MKTRLLLIMLMFLTVSIISAAEEADRITEATAIANASMVLGLDGLEGWQPTAANQSVSLVTLVDTVTPFAREALNNREVYKVHFESVPLDFRRVWGDRIIGALVERDFDVTVDAKTGVVLVIELETDSLEAKLASGEIRIPSAEVAERQLGGGMFYGFPSENPPVSFIEIMHKLNSPLKAEKIKAVYADTSPIHDKYVEKYGNHNSRTTCQNAWLVDMWGGAGLPHSGSFPTLKPYQKNHIRTLLDADTGRLLWETDVPYALPEAETEE